jgi:nitrate reductase / nitrite oxidoreductase, beta subunit
MLERCHSGVLPDVESLRIPVQYLANLLTAGDTAPVLLALKTHAGNASLQTG